VMTAALLCASGRCDDIIRCWVTTSRGHEKEKPTVEGKAASEASMVSTIVSRSGYSAPVVVLAVPFFSCDWGLTASHLKQQFFPEDNPILVLPRHLAAEDVPLTRQTTLQ